MRGPRRTDRIHRGDERRGPRPARHPARGRADPGHRCHRGVGSVSVDLLAAAGYEMVASTGKPEAAGHLKALGAAEVIGRLRIRTPSRGCWADPLGRCGGLSAAPRWPTC